MSQLTKQTVMRVVRRLGLMAAAEKARAGVLTLRGRANHRRFLAANPDVPVPPLRLMHDPYGVVDYAWYWQSGRSAAARLSRIIDQYCATNDAPVKILEWGCGPARVIRHLASTVATSRFELFGTDYNREAIGWCRAHLPGVAFEINELAPPLPYPDQMFDFVYCLSVFTHLSEPMHHAWFNELRRVVKPGGCLLLTLHGDFYREKLLPDELQRYDSGEIVVRSGFVEGGRMYGAFHGERFVREQLLSSVEVLKHERSENSIAPPQDTWLVRCGAPRR